MAEVLRQVSTKLKIKNCWTNLKKPIRMIFNVTPS
jgi:hypothetical protein